MAVSREAKEGEQEQGVEESIAYSVTTTPWGSSPSSVVVKAYNITSGARTDVTSTVMPAGSASVVGDVITLPNLTALTADYVYRVEVKFTSGSNIYETYFIVNART